MYELKKVETVETQFGNPYKEAFKIYNIWDYFDPDLVEIKRDIPTKKIHFQKFWEKGFEPRKTIFFDDRYRDPRTTNNRSRTKNPQIFKNLEPDDQDQPIFENLRPTRTDRSVNSWIDS